MMEAVFLFKPNTLQYNIIIITKKSEEAHWHALSSVLIKGRSIVICVYTTETNRAVDAASAGRMNLGWVS